MKTRCRQKLIDLANVTPEPVAEQRNEISILPQCHVPEDSSSPTYFKIPVSAQGKLQVHANSKQKLSDHGNVGGKIQAEAFRSQQPGKEGTGSHSAPSRSAAAIPARPRPAKWPGFGDCCEEEAYFPFFPWAMSGWFMTFDQNSCLISALSGNPRFHTSKSTKCKRTKFQPKSFLLLLFIFSPFTLLYLVFRTCWFVFRTKHFKRSHEAINKIVETMFRDLKNTSVLKFGVLNMRCGMPLTQLLCTRVGFD